MSNKQSQTADKGLSYSRGLIISDHKNYHVTKCYKGFHTWIDSVTQPKQWKNTQDMELGMSGTVQ
jgi:hypothetical protein